MMAASTLTFDEAREAFGPPPPHDPLMLLSAALLPIAEEPNQLQKLEASLITADNLQGDAYAEVLHLDLGLGLIPTSADQNRCAQSRMQMEMIFQGWSTSLFQASQQWATMSS